MMSKSPNYILASSAGYKINIANEGHNPYDETTYANKSQFKDVVMTRPGLVTDMYDVHRKSLITVNGYFHPTSFLDEKLYVKEAVPTLLKTGINHIGIYSFFNLDTDLDKIKITEDMIFGEKEYDYHEKVIIKLPYEVDGLFFIFAGYLIVEDDRYLKRLSGNTFAFFPSRLNLLDKIYELYRYRNIFLELGIDVSNYDDSVALYEDLVSNDTIIKLLTRFNTFFVHIKKHTIDYNPLHLEHSTIPNNYRTELHPSKLLIGGHGKALDYKFMRFNDRKYTILTTDAFYNNLINSYTPTYALDLFNKNRKPGDTYRLSSAFFLDMICNKIK